MASLSLLSASGLHSSQGGSYTTLQAVCFLAFTGLPEVATGGTSGGVLSVLETN